MNLYIVRHAIAVQRGTPGYDDDSQRPLIDHLIDEKSYIASVEFSNRRNSARHPIYQTRA